MNVLLTGGAGYIGAHVARALRSAGHTCVVYDNLSTGHRQAVDGKLVVGDTNDGQALRAALGEHAIDAVIHLAASIEAGESVRRPDKYFHNNTAGGLALLEAMRGAGVGTMVFSSTAAVYGTPRRVPIREADPTEPINPYGASKLCVELMMRGYAAAFGMALASLRYFNVGGADPAGGIGEDHDPETHLIPLTLQAALGRRRGVKIFGADYDTPDGTCIRDFVHVMDLADAHVLALQAVRPGTCRVYNLGSGEGFSVREVVETCREVTGREIPTEPAPRRPGDPPRLVASAERAAAELPWRPRYGDLKTIVAHAWAWHSARPEGYDA
jgi:UDP-glucose 4-epimerase